MENFGSERPDHVQSSNQSSNPVIQSSNPGIQGTTVVTARAARAGLRGLLVSAKLQRGLLPISLGSAGAEAAATKKTTTIPDALAFDFDVDARTLTPGP
jgi:hypothetical protein